MRMNNKPMYLCYILGQTEMGNVDDKYYYTPGIIPGVYFLFYSVYCDNQWCP